MQRRDEVLAIMDTSEDRDEVHERSRQVFRLEDPSSRRAVLDTQLSRWTRGEPKRIADEPNELRLLLHVQSPLDNALMPDGAVVPMSRRGRVPRPGQSANGYPTARV
jgi:hypothetical protein